MDSPQLDQSTKEAITALQESYVFTYMDKSANNFMMMCKPYYVRFVLKDLGLLDSTASSDSPYARQHISKDALVGLHSSLLAHSGFAKLSCKLPAYMATVKMHKSPVSFRFITTTVNTTLTPMLTWCTRLLKSIERDICTLWSSTFRSLPEEPFSTPARPWILRSTAAMIPILNADNMRYTPFQFSTLQTHIETYDFERLYTNIPLSDLKERIASLLQEIWSLHESRPHLELKTRGKAHWLDTFPPVSNPSMSRVHRAYGQDVYVVDLHTATTIVCYVIDNAHLCVGDVIMRQVIGIGMGINPAVYLANYFLFTYELAFVRRLVQAAIGTTVNALPLPSPSNVPGMPDIPNLAPAPPLTLMQTDIVSPAHAMTVLRAFWCMGRFIDDLCVIANPFFPDLMYVNQVSHGLIGLYPPSLNLKLTSPMDPFAGRPFCDILIRASFPGGRGPLTTILYDKRRDPRFANITFVRFPHMSSLLSDSCKYNIFCSQWFRFVRITKDVDNFVLEVARLVLALYHKKYSILRLFRTCRCCIGNTHIYMVTRRGQTFIRNYGVRLDGVSQDLICHVGQTGVF